MVCVFRKVKLATPILGKCQHEKIAPDDFNPRHESSPKRYWRVLGAAYEAPFYFAPDKANRRAFYDALKHECDVLRS